jgi:hypothetical protein
MSAEAPLDQTAAALHSAAGFHPGKFAVKQTLQRGLEFHHFGRLKEARDHCKRALDEDSATVTLITSTASRSNGLVNAPQNRPS